MTTYHLVHMNDNLQQFTTACSCKWLASGRRSSPACLSRLAQSDAYLWACSQISDMGSDLQLSEASLPYELLALEAALAAHTKGLEAETAELEGQAKPSLEHLLLSVRGGRAAALQSI